MAKPLAAIPINDSNGGYLTVLFAYCVARARVTDFLSELASLMALRPRRIADCAASPINQVRRCVGHVVGRAAQRIRGHVTLA